MKNQKHKSKIKNKLLISFTFNLCFLFLIFYLLSSVAFAQDDFVGPKQQDYLVTCGVGLGDLCTICDIWALADKVINFILFTLATPILIIVLIAGGFIYLTSGGNPKKTETAKELITSAIIGIVIAFAAWLIVDTILKTLVKQELTPPWNTIKPEDCPKPLEPVAPDLEEIKDRLRQLKIAPAQGTYSDIEARNILRQAGIRINKDNCESALQTDCTSLDGIPKSAINYLLELDLQCGSNEMVCQGFIVTGGTEAGHITHGTGKSVFDIAPKKSNPTAQDYKTLRDFAKSSGAISSKTFCEKPDPSDPLHQKTIPDLDCSDANHIHVEFPR